MVRAIAGLIDREGAFHQGLRVLQPIRGLEQLRQIVEIGGHVGMVRAIAGLIDRQGAFHQRLRFRITCLCKK